MSIHSPLASTIAILYCMNTCPAVAQDRLLIHRDLEVRSQVGGTPAIITPTRCDSSGNVYFRGFEPPNLQLPLLRLSADGSKATPFKTEDSSKEEFELKSVAAFAVHPDARVFYLVTDTKERPRIIEYDKDGSFKRIITLDRDLVPSGMAVFASGGFFVSGMTISSRDPFRFNSMVGLFDDRGRFVRRIDIGETSVQPGLDLVESRSDYVYLLRQGPRPYILLISAAGEVLRRIHIDPPKDMAISDFRVGSGQMLIRFFAPATGLDRETAVFSLYDNMEGRKLVDYAEAPGARGSFACFDWKNTFTYLSLDDRGQRTLITGTVR